MQKTEFIKAVAEKAGVSQKETKLIVEQALAVIQEALAHGEKITLTGFGTFELRERAAREGVNPQTRETTGSLQQFVCTALNTAAGGAYTSVAPGDSDFAGRWRRIKKTFSKQIPVTEHRSAVRQRRGERGIWQRRYWEHLIRDEVDYRNHVDYIHYNPVKHGLVSRATDWPHSSLHRHIRRGLLPPDWSAPP